jgi:hypothetical protein
LYLLALKIISANSCVESISLSCLFCKISFAINTAGVPDNTTLYYSISGSSGLVAGDFDDNALSGSFVINSGTSNITKTLALDFTTEGNETFTLSVRRGSITGTILATSPTITIVDTSLSLYEFSSFNFTNAGATGRTGPTLAQCLSSYNTTTYPWLTDTNFFNVVTQGIQLWTVKIGGVYEFDVRGARGGSYTPSNYVGAYGARIVSRVTLSIGQVIAIAVGQKGQDSSFYGTAGGGSFVVLDSTNTPLIVAGGGAGAYNSGGGNADTNAQGQTTTSGGPANSNGGQRHPDLYLCFRKVHSASFTPIPEVQKGTLVITGDMKHKHLEFVFLDQKLKQYSISEEIIRYLFFILC